MNIPFTGGCACGAVRYECGSEPMFSGNCHCRDCQKMTGGAYLPALGVPAPALKITGEVNYHETRSDGGNRVERGFCPNCGSRLFDTSTGFPGITVISAGSLDDPSQFKPELDIFTSSAQPWDFMNPELPKFARSPQS